MWFGINLAFLCIFLQLISVNGQQVRIGLPRPRQCPKHTPLPTNDTFNVAECLREAAAARQLRVPDVDKRSGEIIVDHGYTYESHHVTSSDGYIQTIHRITGGRRSPPANGKPSVILSHGLGSCSEAWFVLPSEKNFAFKLADAGYDVWIPDARGADTSQQHTSLDADRDLDYWDFSFHEMGAIDLPAIVDLMLEKSGNEKVFYIGHSQGGAIYLVGASEVPELNDKIHAALLMAPAAFLGGTYIPSFAAFLPVLYTPVETIIYRLFRGRLEQRDPRTFLSYLGVEPIDICSVRALQCELCDLAYFSFFDFNPSQYNFTNSPYISRMLNSANLKSYIHFGQNILSCEFRKFDYGTAGNQQRYGNAEPPAYALDKLTAPVYIYYGEQDYFSTPPDIQKLARSINPHALKDVIRVSDDTFDHADFAIAKDADTLVYNGMIDLMNSYL